MFADETCHFVGFHCGGIATAFNAVVIEASSACASNQIGHRFICGFIGFLEVALTDGVSGHHV